MSNFGILLSAMPYPAVSSQDIVSPSSAEIIRHISSIFYWCVGEFSSFQAMVAALFMNIYIVGLNQLSDIEIDKINKPYLPLASEICSAEIGGISSQTSEFMAFEQLYGNCLDKMNLVDWFKGMVISCRSDELVKQINTFF
ncbi:aromatic prenyltransferase PT2, chloroplastic-like isoform X5 [Arachis ipaensis]|uniref:aromatic prenyltransferase PT2, chloroplastic-like isoform X5 n=1 Tax=Arachis ipaensis TaxID=130454 RepID=UPI000A2B5EAB|nr:aromatic prenyltransferase PT2, chloroplastic-like isoform X5 [Arachis ipaensis]XP_029146023.1 2-acyl-4-prenylphloroglucinol 6-prenyltransferase, chloroplastic isoform X4 [Arachis hypogaea]